MRVRRLLGVTLGWVGLVWLGLVFILWVGSHWLAPDRELSAMDAALTIPGFVALGLSTRLRSPR